MGAALKNGSHLGVVALAFLLGLGAFILVRQAFVPKGFGANGGHYRTPFVTEARNHAIAYAGQQACATCHEDKVTLRAKGKHANVACEACHGALAKHAEDPSAVKPTLPDTTKLCRKCHEADKSKPKWFPQVVSAEHSGGAECKSCHQPHNPHL